MLRSTYIVAYDICDARRLRRVFKTCKNYGEHLQYSVFECDLDDQERAEMENKLGDLIKHDEDQVLFIRLGPTDRRGSQDIQAVGKPYFDFDSPCYVV